jgi:predicted nuclease of restriction endonuclease-like (RecB) superfamily
MQGLSPRNLGYMKAFAKAWPEVSILQASLAKITWYHNLTLLEKVTSSAERLTNFETALPAPQSDLAQQILKDPYNFDFLTLTNEAQERDLERGLLAHLRQFLIELGVGFSFAGSQVPLEVGGEDFKLDLLFYHFKLRGLRGYRSKDGSVQARVCGLWNFYLSAVHDLLATRMTSRATATLWPRVATLWMWNSTFKDMSLASGWMRLGPRVQCG